MSVIARFWSLVDIRDQRECWLWKGKIDRCGYGVADAGLQIAFGEPNAHRIACALTRRRQSDLAEVLHSCDEPSCCNPRHLRWGSRDGNAEDKNIAAWARDAIDRITAGLPISDVGPFVITPDERAPILFRRGLRRFDDAAVLSVRADFANGMTVRDIAIKHGMTQSHADSIAKRRIRRDVGE